MNLVGLDIETTGTNYNAGHRLIQIGIAFKDGTKLKEDVQPVGKLTIDPEALDVNGFTLQRIAKARRSDEVDRRLSEQLADLGWTEGSLTPVGWNVGDFDLGFIRHELPLTAEFFSYRVVDLTGIAILHELRTGQNFRKLKARLAEEAVEILGRDERHDALYDAEAALLVLNSLVRFDWVIENSKTVDKAPDLIDTVRQNGGFTQQEGDTLTARDKSGHPLFTIRLESR
jgi:DNA polymerase III epsilon subunit-like protein